MVFFPFLFSFLFQKHMFYPTDSQWPCPGEFCLILTFNKPSSRTCQPTLVAAVKESLLPQQRIVWPSKYLRYFILIHSVVRHEYFRQKKRTHNSQAGGSPFCRIGPLQFTQKMALVGLILVAYFKSQPSSKELRMPHVSPPHFILPTDL